MKIDIVFDPVCPWCFIGKRRLDAALRMRPDLVAEITWRPFLLNPEIPAEGLDRSLYLIRKFGSEARIKRVYGAITQAGLSEDIDFAFDDIRRTPSSMDAHRLVRFADRHNGAAHAAVEALFTAYFNHGRNIGDPAQLVSIGKDLGLDAEAFGAYLESDADVDFILDENARAHRQGLNGVPSFVFEGRLAISGAHEASVLARMLDAAEAGAAIN